MRDIEREREREAETQAEAEGEANSIQGARCGTQLWVSRIMHWAEGRCLTAEPPRHCFCKIYYRYSLFFLNTVFFKDCIYPFETERERERETKHPQGWGGASHPGSMAVQTPMWD